MLSALGPGHLHVDVAATAPGSRGAARANHGSRYEYMPACEFRREGARPDDGNPSTTSSAAPGYGPAHRESPCSLLVAKINHLCC